MSPGALAVLLAVSLGAAGSCDPRGAAADLSLLQTRQSLSETTADLASVPARDQVVFCEEPHDERADKGYISFGFRTDASRPNLLSETVRIFDVPERAFDFQTYPHAQISWLSSSSIRDTARTFSTETGIDAKYKAFSSSARVSTERIKNEKVENYRVDQLVQVRKYQVTLNTLNPHQLLTPAAKSFLLEETPEDIVKQMGEFYARKLTLGGIFQVTYLKEKSQLESMKSFESEVKVNAKFLVGSVSGHSKVNTTNTERELLESVSVHYEVQGGDTTVWVGLTGDNADEIQAQWAATVEEGNLPPVQFSLRPIWTLLESDDMDPSKAKEVESYLTAKWAAEDAAIPTYEIDEGVLQYNTEYVLLNQYGGTTVKAWLAQDTINGAGSRLTHDVSHFRTKQTSFKVLNTNRGGAGPVNYGDEILIESMASPGYYLQRDSSTPKFTADTGRISNKAAVWTLLDTDLKGSGPVSLSDLVVIQNVFAGDYWLERCCSPMKPGFVRDHMGFDVTRIELRTAVWKFGRVPQGV